MNSLSLILMGVFLVTIVFIYFEFKVTNFNKLIEGLARTVRIDFKVYGHLSKEEEKKLSQYSTLIINLLKNSESISSSVDIKLIPKNGRIDCEIKFLGALAVGRTLVSSSSRKFNNAFSTLRLCIEKNGGEIIVVNNFNQRGESISTGLQFSI